MARHRRVLVALMLWIALAAVAGSCAKPPAPTPAPTPPSPTPTPMPPETTEVVPVEPAPPPPPVPPPALHEPRIAIGLAVDLSGVTLGMEGDAVIEGGGRHALKGGEQLSVTIEQGHTVLRGLSSSTRRWMAKASKAETLWVTAEEGTAIQWNGRRWRGQFKIFRSPRGKLTLATRLPLETYLVGVLPGEIGPLADNLVEAGRAQAIAARSFTLYYQGRRGVEGFDLFATVEDQLYGSIDAERPLATQCVEATAGQTALSGGQPIRANYCSTCGGITADVWEAWPAGSFPYLVSHLDDGSPNDPTAEPAMCAASPHFRWREEWSPEEFAASIARNGAAYGVPLPRGGVGRITNVRVDARSRSGRVWRLRVETTTGQIVIPAWSLRQVIRRPGRPESILRSTLFKVDVKRASGSNRVIGVVASGAGSGHGVGLCQTGAIGMARLGRSAQDIILHYYRGVEIRQMY